MHLTRAQGAIHIALDADEVCQCIVTLACQRRILFATSPA
jgi:hypothetical protein